MAESRLNREIRRQDDGMSEEPKPGPRPKTGLHLVAIGIGVGVAIVLSTHPSWQTVLAGVVFGAAFAPTVRFAQSLRANH